MKTTKTFYLSVLTVMFVFLLNASCQKDDNTGGNDTCNGVISVKASGALDDNICFINSSDFGYTENERVYLSASGNNQTYGFDVSVVANDGTFTGPGTYNCGQDQPGFVELVIHGNENEFYKSISGTITITEVDQNRFKGSFNVEAKGYYNQQGVTLSGTFNYTGNK
jgi:hypothetical protein